MIPRTLLLLCLLLAGCAAPAPPPPPHAVSHPSLPRLAAQRARFLATGDPVDVFPVFYYHSTNEVLRLVGTGALRHPGIMHELITEFHALYARSRSPALREPVWQPYYQRAELLRSRGITWSDIVHPRDLFPPHSLSALGGHTHLYHDFPRCIARVLARHPEFHGPRLAELEADFLALDSVFRTSILRALQDLAARIPHAPGPRTLVFQSRLACTAVIRLRHRAWRNGAAMALRPAAGNPALRHSTLPAL